MAAIKSDQHWRDFYDKNILLPPAFDRAKSAQEKSIPVSLHLQTVEGVTSKIDGAAKMEFHLQVSLFDIGYHQFFGRQWVGPPVDLQGVGGQQKPYIKYNESIYFHTLIHSSTVVAVVELVTTGTLPNGHMQKVASGWGIIRMFKDEELPDTSRGVKLPLQRVQLYYGTPRALYFLDEPVENNSELKAIPDCVLNLTVGTHKAMYRFYHLIPENTIVGSNDVIPGLVDSQAAGKDHLKKPKLLPSKLCQINGVKIQLNPNIQKFEEEFSELMHEDRLNMQNRASDGTAVAIVERRLLIGVHNGWCFVEKPQTFHIDTKSVSSAVKVGASPSVKRSQRFRSSNRVLDDNTSSEDNVLLLKQKVQISDMLEDPMFAIIFILEYVISEPLSEEDKKLSKTMLRGNTRSVTVRWAAWNPFAQPAGPQVFVALHGGPSQSPDEEFVYKMPDTSMQDALSSQMAGGILSFIWGTADQDGQFMPMIGSQFQPGSFLSMRDVTNTPDGSDIFMMESQSRKPPSGKSRLPASVTSLPVPQSQQSLEQSLLQPQMMPLQYAQVNYNQQLYVPMQQGPVGMYSMQSGQMMPRDLQELPYQPTHTPIITTVPQPKRGSGLSRAAYAKLYSVGFPPILDRNGQPPEVIDPGTEVQPNTTREMNDPLQCNEIVFQFLAMSRNITADYPISSKNNQGTVFFTFQFYRCPQLTTERLQLVTAKNELSSDADSVPYILKKLDKDNTSLKGPPGLEVRYFMDPAFMKPGENQRFIQHLTQQTLHIDVWDGDSLILIGSTSVELKYLCRNGYEAVQTTFELDVIATEYDNPDLHQGDVGAAVGVRPTNDQTTLKGKLHLQMANVGHPVDPKAFNLDAAYVSLPSKTVIVVSQFAGKSGYAGGSLTAHGQSHDGQTKKKALSMAQHLAENNREVSSLLISRKHIVEPCTVEAPHDTDAERQRKLARMNAIRNLQGEDNKGVTITNLQRGKTERMRDYKTMEIYRLQTKKDGILSMLSQSISTEHTIHPSFGTAEFFEFVLRNPFNVQHMVQIQCDDKDLRVVTDAREWRYFKQLNQLSTPIEEGMFNKEPKSHYVEIFMRPKETVNIPFKFLTFQADQSVQPQGPVDPFQQERKTKTKQFDSLKERVVKVSFKGEEDKPMAILLLKVEPQPHIVNQTFRFHHPEQSFLKRSIRLKCDNTLPGVPVGGSGVVQAFIRCSDPNVISDSKGTQPGEPHDIFFKVPIGSSPQIKRFFMAVYLDSFLSKPVQIWQIYAHALQRVDVAAVEGQTSRFSLIQRGTQSSRLVKCFSSHPQEMSLYPEEQFMLAAGAVHEINIAIRPMVEGHKTLYLNVVDVEFHQLICSWLICVNARAPMISRAFDVVLPVGGGKGSSKKITYTNPYPHRKNVLLHTNRQDLLQFKESRLEIDGGAICTIGLRFVPVMQPGTAEILVFINDEDDKNEETFRVAAVYQRMVATS
ncbi:hypothetical protein CHS0354_000253 [Potamilus streckersoni]|uniref:Nephrocystin-4 n=1 Tax=Potamilus streckersoni TaxID=2493646 RepID=A0AAE0SMH9_9BIVA|nr:hypothetical protein CHS0354_000253 [Potamilus streckersoni]